MRVGDKNPFYGKHHTSQFKEKLSRERKGKPSNRKNYTHSIEARQKISLSRKGKIPWNKGKAGLQTWTDEQRIKYRKTVGKKVKCIETNTIYNCIKEAGEINNIPEQNICAVCNGKRKTAGGFHWEHVNWV